MGGLFFLFKFDFIIRIQQFSFIQFTFIFVFRLCNKVDITLKFTYSLNPLPDHPTKSTLLQHFSSSSNLGFSSARTLAGDGLVKRKIRSRGISASVFGCGGSRIAFISTCHVLVMKRKEESLLPSSTDSR